MLFHIQKKCNYFFPLIISLAFFNGFVNGQSLTVSPGHAPHTKTYINQWLHALRAVDQFGVPSVRNRRIKLVLIGPDQVPLNSKQHFTLRLLTENWSQNSSKPNTAYIENFNFYFLSTNGYVELVDKPKYTVMAKNSLTRTVVKDIPAAQRNFYQYFSKSGGAFIKALPGIGKILNLSENLALTAQSINLKDVNWGEIWHLTSEYDLYPILKPIYCHPAAYYRMVEIDIPFIKKKKNGQLLFIADSIVIRPFAQEEPAVMFKTFDKVLLSDGYPEVLTPMIQPKTAKLTQGTPVSTFPSRMFLQVNYQLMEDLNGNIISLKLLPSSKLNYSARIENIYCAIEAPKSTIAVSGRPQYYNFEGQKIDWETFKDQSNRKLVKEWGKFALSFIPGIDAIMSLFSVWQTSVKAKHHARKSTSFSALIKKKWAYEHSTNFFPLPPLRNYSTLEPDGLQGCTLEIPVEIYSFDVPKVTLHVQGMLHQRTIERGDSYSAFHSKVVLDFSKKPPKQFDFYNATYDINFGWPGITRYKFRNGEWFLEPESKFRNGESLTLISLNKTHYFKKANEYTLLFFWGSGNRGGYTIVIGFLENDSFIPVQKLESRKEPQIKDSGIITYSIEYLPSDAHCCPSYMITEKWVPRNNKFVLVSKIREKQKY